MAQEISPGFNSFRPIASSSGASLDCSLVDGTKIGGGTPTDNTTTLNALLASASATNPVFLLLDGPTACTGLLISIPGYTTIEGLGWDCGIWINSGSNKQPLSNHVGAPFEGGTIAGTQGQNVILKSFRIRGNRGNGITGNSNSGDPRGTFGVMFYAGIDLANIDHLRLEHLLIEDTSIYGIRLQNCNDVIVTGCRFVMANATNCDSLHIDGPATDVRIDNSYFNSVADDAIALNAPEGTRGPISRVVIDNCIFNNCLTAVRTYGFLDNSHSYTVSAVSITNCVGSVVTAAFFLGEINTGSKPFDQIASWSASHCYFDSQNYIVKVADSVGILIQDDITWVAPISAKPWVHFETTCSISDLQFSNCRIYRNPAGNANAYAVQCSNTGIIKKLTFNGFTVTDAQGQSYGQTPYLIDIPTNGFIGQITINSIDTKNIAALVNPATLGFSGIGSIIGPGVLATGFQFPDSVMGNGSPYISATAPNVGAVCIKIGGIVTVLSGASSNSPVQQWLMNEGSGTTFADSSGHANNLTATSVTFSSISGAGFLMSTFGSGSYATAANHTNTAFSGSTPFSVSLWATFTNLTTAVGEEALIGTLDTSNNFIGWELSKDVDSADNKPRFRFFLISNFPSDSMSVFCKTSSTLNTNTLIHMVATYDGSKAVGGMKVYINGSLASGSNVGSSLSGNITNALNVRLGQRTDASLQHNGTMADIRIYPREISSSEVSSLYSTGVQ